MTYNIKRLNKNDLMRIQHLQPEGWNDIIYYFSFFTQVNYCYSVCIEKNNEVIAVGNAILNKGTGWLSHIIVDKNFRRQGFGYHITRHLVEVLLKKQYKTILLIASAEGEPLYKKLGFKIDCCYLCYQGKKLNYESSKGIIRAKNKKHLNSIAELDQMSVNEDRSKFILSFIKEKFIYIDEFKEVKGYFMPIFAEGLIIAENYKTGIELLNYKHSLRECRSIVPEANKNAINYFEQNEFIQYNQVSRMYYGNKLDWHPENVYSRVGGYIG